MPLGVESIDFHMFASGLQLSFEFVPLECFLSLETVRMELHPSSPPPLQGVSANCAIRMLFWGRVLIWHCAFSPFSGAMPGEGSISLNPCNQIIDSL